MTLQEIENSVKELTPEQLAKFRDWFQEYEANQWDQQIENDAFSGKLDAISNEAINEHRDGNTSTL